MIEQLGQVMLYVEDQQQAMEFWTTKLGFTALSDTTNGLRVITLVPKDEGQTAIVLHDKKKIAEMSPELVLATPSLMFIARDVQGLYDRLVVEQVTVGELVDTPYGKVFNFADFEGNYFAVTERL